MGFFSKLFGETTPEFASQIENDWYAVCALAGFRREDACQMVRDELEQARR
jgi:hypothetical protein